MYSGFCSILYLYKKLTHCVVIVAVSVGSTLALFLGASFLTAWEILVNFVMRPISDYFRKYNS